MKYMPSRGAQSRIGKRRAVSVRQLYASWCASKHRASRASAFFDRIKINLEALRHR
jgi:hypothetical protein